MNFFRTHIFFKVAAIFLATILLTPSCVKFFHIFENHSYQVCKNPQKTHFHKLNTDCEICKLKTTTRFIFSTINFQLPFKDKGYVIIATNYFFSGIYQNLHFSKRGPPQVI